MTMISPVLSQHLRKMSFISALCVVFVHSAVGGEKAFDRMLFYAVAWGICSFAVPFYFMASGYFVAGQLMDGGGYRRVLKKRFRTLVIPYFSWLALFLGLHIASQYIKTGSVIDLDLKFIGDWFGLNLFKQTALLPFWYIRNLMILILITPLIVKLQDVLAKYWFVGVGVFYLYFLGFVGRYDQIGFVFYSPLSLVGLFYYSLGMYARSHSLSLRMSSGLKTMMIVLSGSAIISGTILDANGLRVLRDIVWIVGIPPLLCVVWWLVGKLQLPEWLVRCSFGVFALHMFVIQFLNWFPIRNTFSGYVLRGTVACACSIAMTVVLKKTLPRTMNFLCGGRC